MELSPLRQPSPPTVGGSGSLSGTTQAGLGSRPDLNWVLILGNYVEALAVTSGQLISPLLDLVAFDVEAVDG